MLEGAEAMREEGVEREMETAGSEVADARAATSTLDACAEPR